MCHSPQTLQSEQAAQVYRKVIVVSCETSKGIPGFPGSSDLKKIFIGKSIIDYRTAHSDNCSSYFRVWVRPYYSQLTLPRFSTSSRSTHSKQENKTAFGGRATKSQKELELRFRISALVIAVTITYRPEI